MANGSIRWASEAFFRTPAQFARAMTSSASNAWAMIQYKGISIELIRDSAVSDSAAIALVAAQSEQSTPGTSKQTPLRPSTPAARSEQGTPGTSKQKLLRPSTPAVPSEQGTSGTSKQKLLRPSTPTSRKQSIAAVQPPDPVSSLEKELMAADRCCNCKPRRWCTNPSGECCI